MWMLGKIDDLDEEVVEVLKQALSAVQLGTD